MKRIALLVAVTTLSAPAFATDGYFSHGYGMTAKGMGGAATAMTKDTFGGANNPAGMVWVGDRMDIGLDLFAPKRSASRTGSGNGLDSNQTSGSNLFYVPEFGYNKMLGSDKAVGVTVYGNGGMNTDYPVGNIPAGPGVCGTQGPGAGSGFNWASQQGGPYNILCGSGKLGVNLEQLIVAPTFSMKLNKDNSIGVSLLLGYQRFRATGLSSFFGYTSPAANAQGMTAAQNAANYAANNNLTDRGNDNSTGAGLRLGWLGKISDTVTLGAAYATRMRMSKFDKYKDLFAEQGGFDMPENWNVGAAFKATPQLTLALDYQRINYSAVKSIGNSSRQPLDGVPPTAGIPNSLGCDSCRGFGWSDVNVVKFGAEYQYSPTLTLRAGYNHSSNPIQARDVTFNILAPGVVQDHYTLGMTFALNGDSDLTFSYMHAPEKSVSGASLFNSWVPPATAVDTIKMKEDSLGIAYSIKFK